MSSRILPWLAMTMLVLVGLSNGYFNKAKQQCGADTLVGLATCLPYVTGQDKAPTPDCCDKLKPVLDSNKVCLCILVKDRDEPDLWFKINATLALGLPDLCHLSSNITQCPKLMKWPPNSKDTKIFEDYVKTSSGGSLKNDVVRGKVWGTLYLIIMMLIVI